MAHFLERLGTRWGRGWLYAGLAVVVGGLLVVGMTRGRDKATGDVATEQSAVARRGPFVLSANFTGRIAPGARIDVTAPFDSRVAEVRFTYGDQVEAGQVLVELDPADVGRSRAEAEIAWLRAEAEASRLDNWEQGPEVKRAARAVTTADAELGDIEAKLAETKALLDRGLVPRGEYDTIVQQRRQRQAAATAAREDLADTARRGQGGERRIALLQRGVARSQYAGVGGASSGPVILAPQAGVVVRPDDGTEGGTEGVHSGSRVSKGQLLGVIASTAGLDVIFKLDEADLAAVKTGQRAVVTGPGFGGNPLMGTVLSVGGEAEAAPAGGKATFEARVRLDRLSDAAARDVRIGMTANIAIATYQNPAVVTVPPQAVQGAAPRAYVMVRSKAGRGPQRRPVGIGRVGPAAVEVLSGLELGETVVWGVPAGG
jgi:multidrug efflux pump subunit AcrA (membrane-fusion protein)